MTHSEILWIAFAAVMAAFLAVDLGWLNRKAHAVSVKSATLQSLFWVTVSMAYAALVWALAGAPKAADFVSAYFTEKMLSVDNLFVILCIFAYFKVKDEYRHRVLYWGIIGAVLLRGIFIGTGTAVISHFHWLLYFFGAFLIWSGGKMLLGGEDDEEKDFSKNKVWNWSCKNLNIWDTDNYGKFTVWVGNQKLWTSLFAVLLVVETTDLLFSFDSIPAVLAITQDPLIAFTSNIFAVMGLRALFFVVDGLMKRLRYLQQGISFVLIVIGAKMLAEIFGIHLSSLVSLGVVVGSLAIAAVASLLNPEKS